LSVALRGLSSEALHYLSDREFLERVSLSNRVFRDGCLRVAYRSSPYSLQPRAFKEEIQKGVTAFGWDSWIDLSRLRTPSGNVWKDRVGHESGALASSTIHSFKGLQSPAVALVIPAASTSRRSGVEFWDRNEPDETRRVLYVGASRAEKLLLMVVHQSQIDAVSSCLERDKVPFDLLR
jgi:hypothetical protein